HRDVPAFPTRRSSDLRAAYRMVLSPERADGLDLKALTGAAMAQLGRDVGATPPWIAAIHRNTKHPHVHIVMAARRELAPGLFGRSEEHTSELQSPYDL